MSDFSAPAWSSLDPAALAVVTTIGLAIVSDESVTTMTGGAFQPPAAVICAEVVTLRGATAVQLLASKRSLAALHGALQAWSRMLPVGDRDQYDALAAEAEGLYVKGVHENQDRLP